MNKHRGHKNFARANADELELCPSCLNGNVPGSHFCADCGAPLSSCAAIMPFERLFAQGHIYRTATDKPKNILVLLGIWLLFGSHLLVFIAIGIHEVSSNGIKVLIPDTFNMQYLITLFLVTVINAFLISILFKTTINYIRSRRGSRRNH